MSRVTKKMVAVCTGILVLLFLFIMMTSYKIDTSLSFAETPASQSSPRILQTWQELIKREVSDNTFVPNRPFFSPSAYLSNMGAFQRGVIDGLSKYTTHLALNTDNKDLIKAAELLRYPPDIWLFGTSEDGKISKSSTQQYKLARRALEKYTLQTKKEDFLLNTDQGIALSIRFIRGDLRRILDYLTSKINGDVEKDQNYSTSKVFFFVKGRVYVHALFLRDMIESDATDLTILEKQHLRTTLKMLEDTANLDPWIVLNSSMNRTFMANHLAYEAYGISGALRSLLDFEKVHNK